ncbi:hypothetical protein CVM73_30850 [Bradyrhizobium forestalis]|uniref:Uncharacterized protein n=1 Tax=Bradyrhizobium forestalis TaxID=1419263 RepID=A0A2M8R0W9_9BRAD|nr:hypothetical protein [Bradyrhizobium forestalis]PJG51484.1 hypothetical protein CVM73_30850 [Bradyrhizobium forestalis]
MFSKKMGKTKGAQQVITDWLEANKDEPRGFFEIRSGGFAVQDPGLRKAIMDKYSAFTDDRGPAEVLFDIAKNRGWRDEDIDLLAKVRDGGPPLKARVTAVDQDSVRSPPPTYQQRS